MEHLTTSPKKFANWFNGKYLGVHRRITIEDVNDMTVSGLIGRYRYYSESLDGEIIRGILQYEQIRDKRADQESVDDESVPLKCKLCGQPLHPKPENKTGRPREYCLKCEPLRNKDRQSKLRCRRRKLP